MSRAHPRGRVQRECAAPAAASTGRRAPWQAPSGRAPCAMVPAGARPGPSLALLRLSVRDARARRQTETRAARARTAVVASWLARSSHPVYGGGHTHNHNTYTFIFVRALKKWVCRSWPTHTVPTPVQTGYARKGTPMAMNSGKLYAGVARRGAHAPATAASASCRDRRSVKIGSFSRGHAGVQRA